MRINEKINLEWINQQIKTIEEDSRFQATPASLFSNAPLAVIQTELNTQHKLLIKVRELVESQQNKLNDLYGGIAGVKECLDYLDETLSKAKELDKLVIKSTNPDDEPVVVQGEDAKKLVLGMSMVMSLIKGCIGFEKAE